MMTSSNGNIFRVTGHLCGEFTGLRWIPRTKASDAELWCFLWCARLSKHSRGWWFETLSHPLWRHRNVTVDQHENLTHSIAFLHSIALFVLHWVITSYPQICKRWRFPFRVCICLHFFACLVLYVTYINYFHNSNTQQFAVAKIRDWLKIIAWLFTKFQYILRSL